MLAGVVFSSEDLTGAGGSTSMVVLHMAGQLALLIPNKGLCMV